MFRHIISKPMCLITIGACAVIILVGYHHMDHIGYRLSPTVNQLFKNFPRTKSQDYVDTILEMTRAFIKIETWKYNFSHSGVDKLEDLVMESGGTPVRSVVVSTWRSGSSFLGDLINSVPGSFYSYEPLMMFDVFKQIRGPPNAARAIEFLKNLMKCDFNNKVDLPKYFAFAKNKLLFSHNTRFWHKCSHQVELCFDANFTAKFCKLFPFQVLKLDRFRLPLINDILKDKELNMKVILLVRDPRGVMQSRRYIKNFCSPKNISDCADVKSLCSDMATDYRAAANIRQKYPNRVMVLRFEDLALNLEVKSLQLFRFLGLDRSQSVRDFLRTHTTISKTNHYSTFRVTKNIPFKWRKAMKFSDVKEIQQKCKGTMAMWGYKFANNASHMVSKKFNPLGPYSLKLKSERSKG